MDMGYCYSLQAQTTTTCTRQNEKTRCYALFLEQETSTSIHDNHTNLDTSKRGGDLVCVDQREKILWL
jgi:hypothetical protein